MLGVACVLNALIGLSISLANDAATESEFRATAAQAIAAYRGGFRDAVWQRLRDLQVIYAFTPLFTWPTAIAMFALGLVAGRSGLFRDPSRLMELARLRWRLVVTIGVLGNAAYATFGQSTEHTVLSALSFGALPIAGPMLTLMYVRWLWKFVERHPHALLTRASRRQVGCRSATTSARVWYAPGSSAATGWASSAGSGPRRSWRSPWRYTPRN